MGLVVTKAKFHWSYTDEPHATRRTQMLKVRNTLKLSHQTKPLINFSLNDAVGLVGSVNKQQ